MKVFNFSHLMRIAQAVVERDNRERISLFRRLTGGTNGEKPKPETCFRSPPEVAIV
jgi:hypothetical protein